jgi:hypothetical protein
LFLLGEEAAEVGEEEVGLEGLEQEANFEAVRTQIRPLRDR